METKLENGVDLSVHMFREAWTLMCRGCEGRSVESTDGVDYIFSGLPIGFFNVALLTGHAISADALSAHGHAARAWATPRNIPWLFVVTHEELGTGVDPVAVLDACGLAPVIPLTGMFAQQITAGASVPDDLRIAVPEDDASCAAVLDVNSAAYAMDLQAAKVALGRYEFWSDHVPMLGTVDGTPASSATVLMADGYRYVALVATDPAFQRRGYADAVMRRALDVAARTHGELPTVLHATEAGRPVYQRMGYTPIAAHTLYMDKAFLGH